MVFVSLSDEERDFLVDFMERHASVDCPLLRQRRGSFAPDATEQVDMLLTLIEKLGEAPRR